MGRYGELLLVPSFQVIGPAQLSLPGRSGEVTSPGFYAPGTPLEVIERDHIARTLEFCGGNQSEAARLLGIGRNTLARKLRDDEA